MKKRHISDRELIVWMRVRNITRNHKRTDFTPIEKRLERSRRSASIPFPFVTAIVPSRHRGHHRSQAGLTVSRGYRRPVGRRVLDALWQFLHRRRDHLLMLNDRRREQSPDRRGRSVTDALHRFVRREPILAQSVWRSSWQRRADRNKEVCRIAARARWRGMPGQLETVDRSPKRCREASGLCGPALSTTMLRRLWFKGASARGRCRGSR